MQYLLCPCALNDGRVEDLAPALQALRLGPIAELPPDESKVVAVALDELAQLLVLLLCPGADALTGRGRGGRRGRSRPRLPAHGRVAVLHCSTSALMQQGEKGAGAMGTKSHHASASPKTAQGGPCGSERGKETKRESGRTSAWGCQSGRCPAGGVFLRARGGVSQRLLLQPLSVTAASPPRAPLPGTELHRHTRLCAWVGQFRVCGLRHEQYPIRDFFILF